MLIEKYLTGPLQVNTYLVVDEKTKKSFLVDPGGFSQKIVNDIFEKGATLDYILLTHGHGDHIGGVHEFKDKYKDVKVVSSQLEKTMLMNSKMNFSRETCGEDIEITPDITVQDNDLLTVGELELKFIMTPGHTVGGMSILVGKFLFSGDTLFQQSIGRTDFPGGSFDEIKASIKNKLFLLPEDTQVLPGHMGPTSIGFEMRNNPFV